jgi:4-diphosphocytidyl-2-C-methyl-D-erythritol kinase
MRDITVLTPAKINLSIDVTGRLENGYHTVEMIMQTIDLYDTVVVEKRKKGITIQCAHVYVPNDQRNIAWKAAAAFFNASPEKGGAHITIKKNIPVAAGLAGGSTNAAGVLKALNRLYGDCLDHDALAKIGSEIGADIPFFIKGGTQLARGTGQMLTPLTPFIGVHVVLVKPPFPVSTQQVYKNLDLGRLGERPDIPALIDAINKTDIKTVAICMRNVLESVTVKKYPVLEKIMDRFIELGALGSRMSGSGPAIFGIFENEESALTAKNEFLKEYEHVFHVRTTDFMKLNQ